MRRPLLPIHPLLTSLVALLLAAGTAGAAAAGAATGPAAPETSSSAAAPAVPATPPNGSPPQPAPATPPAPEVPAAPEVLIQRSQRSTPGASAGSPQASGRNAGAEQGKSSGGSPGAAAVGGPPAPSPTALTPGSPLALTSQSSGLPSFFVESFRIPPFLLPIYQAAASAYGIPWQVLAAINEVETDYGRDLSVSSAGAEGWMQFLPSSWSEYGVDANATGFRDPYNPADAVFAAASYLRAAGGNTDIRAAVYSYNHSQAYVSSVMLRAQLLGGMPQELLSAVTGLSAAHFPVHAQSHFSDGFQTVSTGASRPPAKLVGTTIYSQLGAPVIAVQGGEIVQIGESRELGRFVSLRDGNGDTYTYAELGSVAPLYPVLRPVGKAHRVSKQTGADLGPAPRSPATAGAQPAAPGASSAGEEPAAASGLQATAPGPPTAPAQPVAGAAPSPPAAVRVFREGSDYVYLHPLRAGVRVMAGTVLGHVGAPSPAGGPGAGVLEAGAPSAASQGSGPHILFQIRPSGFGAPLIDPQPILDGWVALENASVFKPHGKIRGLFAVREALQASLRHRTGLPARPRSAGSAGISSQEAAGSLGPALAPNQWLELMTRVGEIPYPSVSSGASSAAIPDGPSAPGVSERQPGGDH